MNSAEIMDKLQNYLESLGSLLVERADGNVFAELIAANDKIRKSAEMTIGELSGDVASEFTGQLGEDLGDQDEYDFIMGNVGDYGRNEDLRGLTVVEKPNYEDGGAAGIIPSISIGETQLPSYFSEDYLLDLLAKSRSISTASSYGQTRDFANAMAKLKEDMNSIFESWTIYAGPGRSSADFTVLLVVEEIIREEKFSAIMEAVGSFLSADELLISNSSISSSLDVILSDTPLGKIALDAESGIFNVTDYYSEKTLAPPTKEDLRKRRREEKENYGSESEEEKKPLPDPFTYEEILSINVYANKDKEYIALFDEISANDNRLLKYPQKSSEKRYKYKYLDLSEVAEGGMSQGAARAASISNVAARNGFFGHDKRYHFSHTTSRTRRRDLLNFERSIFSGQSDAERLGYQVVEGVDGSAVIDISMDSVISTIDSELKKFRKYVDVAQEVMTGLAMTGEIDPVACQRTYNRHRLAIAAVIDDFVASLISRDNIIAEDQILLRQENSASIMYDLSSSNLLLKGDRLTEFASIIANLVAPNVFFGWYIHANFTKKEGDFDTFSKEFTQELLSQVKKKIKRFFADTGRTFSRSFVDYIDLSISATAIKLKVRSTKLVRLVAAMSKCDLCGKRIEVGRRWQGTVGGLISEQDQKKFLEGRVSYQPYSFAKENGGLISLDDLNNHGPFELTEDESLMISNIYGLNEVGTLSAKTWSQMNDDYLSGDPSRNKEAVLRKSFALKALGGKPAGKVANLVTQRLKCPFKTGGDSGSASLGECGLKIAPNLSSPLLKEPDSKGVNENTMQARVFDKEKDFEDALEYAISSGLIDEDQADKIRLAADNSSLTSGGWKFSRTSFRCPTMIAKDQLIQWEEEADEEYRNRMQSLLKKYTLLATPISGPISPQGGVQMPSDGSGGVAELAPETLSVLVCGAVTSISQFDKLRLRDMINSALNSVDDTSRSVEGIITTLIKLGVDPQDIAPLIRVFKSPDTLLEEESSERIGKISTLMSIAMALKGQRKLLNDFDTLKDVQITCRHGHTFTVGQSVLFGNDYAELIDFEQISHLFLRIDSLINSGIFGLDGVENKIKTLKYGRAGKGSVKLFEKLVNCNAPGYIEAGRHKPYSVPLKNVYWRDGDDCYVLSEGSTLKAETLHLFGGTKDSEDIFRSVSRKDSIKGSEQFDVRAAHIDYSSRSADESLGDEGAPSLKDRMESGFLDDEQQLIETAKLRRLLRKEVAVKSANLIRMYLFSIKDFLSASVSTKTSGRLHYGSKVEPKPTASSFKELLENNEQISKTIGDLVDKVLPATAGHIRPQVMNRIIHMLSLLNERETIFYASLDKGFGNFLWKVVCGAIIYASQSEGDSQKRVIRKNIIRNGLLKMDYKEYEGLIADVASALDAHPDYPLEGQSKIFETKAAGSTIVNQYADLKESEYAQRITMGGAAFYIASQLTLIYERYFNKLSTDYLGIELPKEIFFGYNEDIPGGITIPYYNIDIYSEKLIPEDDEMRGISLKGLQLLESRYMDLSRDLIAIKLGVSDAAKSSEWRSMALDYIRDYINSEIQTLDPADPVRKKLQMISSQILVNPGSATISLGTDSKYLGRYSSSHDLLGVVGGFLVEDLMDAKLRKLTVIDRSRVKTEGEIEEEIGESSAKPNFLNPVYRLTRESIIGFGLNSLLEESVKRIIEESGENISLTKIDGKLNDYLEGDRGCALLFKDVDEGLLLSFIQSKTAESIGSDDYRKIPTEYEGWSIALVNLSKKDFGSPKSRPLRIVEHPGTKISTDENGNIFYENDTLEVNTKDAFFIGHYSAPMDKKSQKHKPFPPAHLQTINEVGIPIPITMDLKKAFTGDKITPSLAKLLTKVSTESGDELVNLSDFLQRDNMQQAWSYIEQILTIWGEFSELPEDEKTLKESVVKSQIKTLFRQYRSLPLMVSWRTRTETNQKTGMILEKQAYYIPLVNSTLMNLLIEKECFHPDWGGHNAWPPGISENRRSEIKMALKEMTIKINGLDKISEAILRTRRRPQGESLFNERRSPSSPDELSELRRSLPFSLLNPSDVIGDGKLLDSRKFSTKGVSKTSNDQYLRFKESKEDQEIIKKNAPEIGYCIGSFFPIHSSSEDDGGGSNHSKIIMRTATFPRHNDPDWSKISDPKNAQSLLSDEHLSAGKAMRVYYTKPGMFQLGFAARMRAWFDKRIELISEGIVESYEEDVDGGKETLDKELKIKLTEGFGREASLQPIMQKVGAKVVNEKLIGKSKKYQTNVFSRTILLDEELVGLLESS